MKTCTFMLTVFLHPLGELGWGVLEEIQSLSQLPLYLFFPVSRKLGCLVEILQRQLVRLASVLHLFEGNQALGLTVIQLVGKLVGVANLERKLKHKMS